MKKITVLVLHLGYGGIEKSVTSLVNELVNDYEIEIVSLYKLYDKPLFEIDSRVNIKYLINSNIAKRVEDYKIYFFHIHWIRLIKAIYNDYLKKLKFISLFKDMFLSIYILLFKNIIMNNYIKKTKSDIYIATRPIHNKIIGNCNGLRVAWEHNHHHNIKSIADKVINSCKKCDYLVCVSNDLTNYYGNEFKKRNIKTKAVFIPNFLDIIPNNKAKLDNLNLINVGRFSKEKGQYDLIKVFDIIHKKNSEIKLNLIGSGHDFDMIEKEVYKKSLHKFVNMPGFKNKDELDKYYLDSSLYVMTSITESFGIVLLEAMSYGIPCIAFDSAEGARELIKNNYNGYLIKNRNEYEMADKILKLLSNKKELKRLGSNALEFSKKYTKEKVVDKWLELLKNNE